MTFSGKTREKYRDYAGGETVLPWYEGWNLRPSLLEDTSADSSSGREKGTGGRPGYSFLFSNKRRKDLAWFSRSYLFQQRRSSQYSPFRQDAGGSPVASRERKEHGSESH